MRRKHPGLMLCPVLRVALCDCGGEIVVEMLEALLNSFRQSWTPENIQIRLLLVSPASCIVLKSPWLPGSYGFRYSH
jgi:hypothetical protein